MLKKVILLLIVALYLAGCTTGPNSESIKKEIQAKLDKNFEKGLFKIEYLSRRGSYPYSDGKSKVNKRLIYYKASIKILKDCKLSNWNGANVGSLISILGSTPLGVVGVKSEGNKKDDLLLIYGSRAYALEKNSWSPILFAAKGIKRQKTSKKPYVVEMEEDKNREEEGLPLYQQHLNMLKTMGKSFEKIKDKKNLEMLQKDLDRIVQKASFRYAKLKGLLTVATGSKIGEYYAIGKALEKTFKKKTLQACLTSGSVANCKLIQKKEATFAISQNDVAFMAYNGRDLFKGSQVKDIRALCSLYPETVQIVVKKDSKIKTLKDLVGKKINIGAKGSGVRINALQILKACGMELKSFAAVEETDFSEAIKQIDEGKVDAMFLTSAYPAKLIQDLTREEPVRLISMSENTVQKITRKHPFFIRIKVAQNAYTGEKDEILTVGVISMLITHKDTPDEKVKLILDKLFGNLSQISKVSLQANYISRSKAKEAISIPVHPAAEKYFEKD